MPHKQMNKNVSGFSSKSLTAWLHCVKIAMITGLILGWIIVTLVFISVGFQGGFGLYLQYCSLGIILGGGLLTFIKTLEWNDLPDQHFESTADFLEYMAERDKQRLDEDANDSDADDDFDFDP